jgi:phosphatidate cytidylyltransferase
MLKQRIITALIMAPIAIAGVFLLPVPGFAAFVALVLLVGAWEWANLAGFSGPWRYLYAIVSALFMAATYFLPASLSLGAAMAWWLLAFVLVVSYPKLVEAWSSRLVRSVIGLVILATAWISMLQLKLLPDSDYLILLLFLLIWGADIGAYFSGRAFGKRKLAPQVSPGKSWAGFFGGMVTALLIAVAMTLVMNKPVLVSVDGLVFLGVCLGVAMISVLGDLTISMFKRNAGVKDSSNLLPGHGGFLDRIDSLLAAGPAFAAMILLVGWA